MAFCFMFRMVCEEYINIIYVQNKNANTNRMEKDVKKKQKINKVNWDSETSERCNKLKISMKEPAVCFSCKSLCRE